MPRDRLGRGVGWCVWGDAADARRCWWDRRAVDVAKRSRGGGRLRRPQPRRSGPRRARARSRTREIVASPILGPTVPTVFIRAPTVSPARRAHHLHVARILIIDSDPAGRELVTTLLTE